MSEWPPRDRRQQPHRRSSPFKQPYRPPRRATASRPGPAPLPDLTQPILIVLALAFLVASLAFCGPPIEIELAYRRLSRWLRRMGLVSWWNGPPSSEAGGELTGQQPPPRRPRGGELNKSAASISTPVDSSLDRSGHFPGLVNSSGAFCFLNSVLQAMAALPPFFAYLSHLHSEALTYDVPSPLLDVLIPLLSALSTPSSSYSRPLRLTALIEAITLAPIFKTSGMFNRMREQQDAQELWQLLMSAVEDEADAIHKIGIKEGTEGFRGLIGPGSDKSGELSQRDSPFKGRLAYRRGCRICGYSEGIRLTAFDSLQLSVPRTLSAPLSSLLESYTSLDLLTDAQCRKCRITQTLKTLERNLPPPPPDDTSGEPISSSKKKRLREARKELERETELVDRVRALVKEGRWEDDVEGVAWELVDGGISTRQDMFSLPPPILGLHLNRSSFSSNYASKNPCRILFPSLLDLTPFCTTGTLSLSPSSSISTPPPPPPSVSSFLSSASPFMVVGPNGTTKAEAAAPTPTPSSSSKPPPQTYYRLSSAIFHLGNHYAGHYITYRRVKGTERWLRVSDEDVAEVHGGVDEVKSGRGDAFMLFYERIDGGEAHSGAGSGSRIGLNGQGRVLRSVRLAMSEQSEGSGSTVASGASVPSTSEHSSSPLPADATLPVLTSTGLGEETDQTTPEAVHDKPAVGEVGKAVEPELGEDKVKKRKNRKKKKPSATTADHKGAG